MRLWTSGVHITKNKGSRIIPFGMSEVAHAQAKPTNAADLVSEQQQPRVENDRVQNMTACLDAVSRGQWQALRVENENVREGEDDCPT